MLTTGLQLMALWVSALDPDVLRVSELTHGYTGKLTPEQDQSLQKFWKVCLPWSFAGFNRVLWC